MSPTVSFLLGLTILIPQAFSLSIPTNPSLGLTNAITVDVPGDNPLPPSPPGWYHIPGTSLSIDAFPPYGPSLPSLPSALTCLAAAHTSISATITAQGDLPLPRPGWHFSNSNTHLAAASIFPGLGTYSQLSSALAGLEYLLSAPGGPGARRFEWVLSDDVSGIVMKGSIAPAGAVRVGATAVSATVASATVASATVASATVSASAAPTQSLGIVAVEELDST